MPSQQQNVSPEQNKQIVHRFMEDCWNQGKLDMVASLFTENCRLHDPVFPNLTSGAQNMRNHMESCRKAFPDLRFDLERRQVERLRALRAKRSQSRWQQGIAAVTERAKSGENLMPAILEAVQSSCTVGEIAGALRGVFGEYQETVII